MQLNNLTDLSNITELGNILSLGNIADLGPSAAAPSVFERLQQIVFDDFNRADAHPIDGNWATVTDFHETQIVSGIARGGQSGPTSSMSYWTGDDPAGRAQWSECEIGAGQTVAYQGVMLRNTNDPLGTFYAIWATNATTIGVHRWKDGNDYALGGFTGLAIVPGDVIRAEVEGPDYRPRVTVYLNDVLLGALADASGNAIAADGKWAYHTLGAGATGLDNYRAGNILYPGSTPPTFDAVAGNKAENGTAAIQWDHTMGAGANGFLAVFIGWDSTSATISSVTCDGVPMTAVPGATRQTSSHSSGEWYYLLAPAAGDRTIEVTLSSGSHYGLIGESISFTGVDQSVPFEEVVTTTSFLTAVLNHGNPKGPAALMLDGHMAIWSGAATTLTVGSNQTERANITSSYGNLGISTEPGDTYDGTSWTTAVDKDQVNIAFTLLGV